MMRGVSESAGELLALVRSGRAHTRTDLRRLTGMSRTAVLSRVAALTEAGLLVAGAELSSTGGRPPGSLVFNAEAGVVLAAAIGRSRSQVAVFDLTGRELASSSLDHEIGAGPDQVMPEVSRPARPAAGGRHPAGPRRGGQPPRHRRPRPRASASTRR